MSSSKSSSSKPSGSKTVIKRRVIAVSPPKEEEQKKKASLNLSSQIPKNKLKLKESRKFTDQDMTMKLEDKEMQYETHHAKYVSQVKWGQRKLILSIIQFFTIYWDPEKIPKPTCVYVGAAPGVSINVMSILFPTIQWILYDSEPMNQGLPSENVTFHQRYFETADVEEYKDKGYFFISDIRGKGYESESVSPEDWNNNENIAMSDMLLQQEWVLKMNPIYAQLKCRFAYTTLPTDMGDYPYLQGIVYRQCYIGSMSAEGRLVPTRNEEGNYYLTKWVSKQYENKFFYFNNVDRNGNLVTYINPFTGIDDNIDPGKEPELTNDWDSHSEVDTISKYLTKMRIEVNYSNVKKISEFITSEINRVRRRPEPHSIHKRRLEKYTEEATELSLL